MISVAEVEQLHKLLIDNFGGSHGIRDRQALDSALSRPFQTFDGNDLYPSIIEKAASLVESILINHPFIDGNKRIGYALLRLYLLYNDLGIAASPDNKYEFVINIASGTLKYDGIVSWLSSNTTEKNGA
jgi:death-on-curing protein